ncbi:MAG: squalene/phytoene synthase family protein [Candidatus Kapabacteria bacterium]|nr:squalene/phytoene synthase family protein [Candidatus Kapabacteria bacterium]
MAIASSIFAKLLASFGRDEFSCESTEDCYALCKHIATEHYENFPVGSFIVGKERQHHFFAIYAFSRMGDDIADETGLDRTQRLSSLELMHEHLGTSTTAHPLFRAVHRTIHECSIPVDALHRLLRAFEQDSVFTQPETWHDMYAYCNLSANPVGEIVLHIFNEATAETIRYSDHICTALQLTNFWQDFSRDIPNRRYYVPQSVLHDCRLPRNSFDTTEFWHKFPAESKQMLDTLIDLTDSEFTKGRKLLQSVMSLRLRIELALTLAGGERILKKTKRLGRTIFHNRPALSLWDIPFIVFNAVSYLIMSLNKSTAHRSS